MAQINVSNLTFYYDGSFDNIFENVSFSIDTNWKLGFIGRNGKGKTTFLNLLLGRYDYKGSINTNVTFDYFPYKISNLQFHQTAAEFVDELKPGCETWQVIRELDGLEETADILYRSFNTLSHGERTKILLAVLFSGDNDFLLIDEPNNHLDKEARQIVKQYLASKKGFILVSHDRDLLDTCTDHCLVLNRSTIEVMTGNFSTWWKNKKRKYQFVIAENEKHFKEINKLKAAASQRAQWADKNERTKIGYDPIKEHDRSISTRAYIGSKTKKMQSRVKQMEKRISSEIEQKEGLLQDIEAPVDLKLVQLTHHKKTLINIKDYSVRYNDAPSPVFSDISLTVHAGDRIAISGKNGCGKSTLLKMILKKAGYASNDIKNGISDISDISVISVTSESGICETVSGLTISYINQDTSFLTGNLSDYCKRHALDKSLFLALLRQLDFDRNQFAKNINEYSEGQKKKILIATSLMTPAHLYIWDEPLNYIDVFSRMQLEELLLKYQPTMIFVEHDIRFCEKICTDTLLL